MIEPACLLAAYETARADLLAERVPAGHWVGELSSSALSTATAISALALVRRHGTLDPGTALSPQSEELFNRLISRGLRCLAEAQNPDGGWGDTDRSSSNIATTLLVQAACRLTAVPAGRGDLLWERAEAYVAAQGGLAALRRRYGRDKTFAVPILTNCALAGLVSWREVSPLPFELACLPQSWFRLLQLPVVSYAIPALVAIGQARYVHRPPLNPLARAVRRAAVERSLKVLEAMQPASGGYLEATPLTSFVVMSLASTGRVGHPVVRRGVEFLLASVRDDGSWPIDTNLATWNTTLAVNALAAGATGNVAGRRTKDELRSVASEGSSSIDLRHSTVPRPSPLPWLLSCQRVRQHPFTGAAPGGWGWSDLSGAVPDVDDTSGALLALSHLQDSTDEAQREEVIEAARLGLVWLLDLQNSDGGWPTFCRGWTRMPFDRSGADLTAHALRAMAAWGEDFGPGSPDCGSSSHGVRSRRALPAPKNAQFAARLGTAVSRGLAYLDRVQRADGSWVPLWFGNQDHPEEENPVYGTAKVLFAYRDLGQLELTAPKRGFAWLVDRQNADGGWGGGTDPRRAGTGPPSSSAEETALAVEALLGASQNPEITQSLRLGVDWLVSAVESKCYRECSPIGFYFAKLWYYERLYPLTFTVSALGHAVGRLSPRPDPAAIAASAARG
jgi:squalene-hopene/tetraprenyl-beta-curcumene cyclase